MVLSPLAGERQSEGIENFGTLTSILSPVEEEDVK